MRPFSAALIVLAVVAFTASAQPASERAVCRRARSTVRIDGMLDETDWTRAETVSLTHCFLTRKGAPPFTTKARFLWDDDALYVAFECEDPDIFGRSAERDSELWEEEVVEVYVDPDGNGRDYLEFEVNPRNAIIDLEIPESRLVRGNNYKQFRIWDAANWRTAVRVEGTIEARDDTDRCWVVEMAIPLTDLSPTPPKPGQTWRVQLYRIDRSKTLAGTPMFVAWSKTDTFHNPKRFGTLAFEAAHE